MIFAKNDWLPHRHVLVVQDYGQFHEPLQDESMALSLQFIKLNML